MNKQSKRIIGLFARYLTVLILGLGNLYLFYKILTPITISAISTALSLFAQPTTANNFIFFGRTIIEIIPACVAGSAFFLLFLLVFSTAEIKPLKRALALITSLIFLFVLNIARIITLALLTTNTHFEQIHWTLWHIASTIFVVAIWLAVIKIYKIKSTPIYTDVKYLISLTKPRKNPKRKKKH